MAAARLGILYDGKAVFQTQLIADTAHRPCGTPKVSKLAGAVKVHCTYYDMIMDMVLINMGADDKSIVSFRQFHGKFSAI